MIHPAVQRDRRAGWTLIVSMALHLTVILIFNNTDFFRSRLHEATPYYVDIVSLPSPSPAPAGGDNIAPAVPLAAHQPKPPVAPQKPAMPLPAKKPASVPLNASPSAEQKQQEQDAREFSERMSRLERNAEARHESDAIAAMRKRVAEKKGAGVQTAAGQDSGVDYGTYIQSRLKDALATTIVYRSQKPEAAVQIYIDRSGKLVRYVMIRPSPDKLFNNSVIKAIEKAKADFPRVPSGRTFEKLFVFSPQEIKQ